jgi:hypothetical protein
VRTLPPSPRVVGCSDVDVPCCPYQVTPDVALLWLQLIEHCCEYVVVHASAADAPCRRRCHALLLLLLLRPDMQPDPARGGLQSRRRRWNGPWPIDSVRAVST